jgi:uncharacterized protein with von Willebrand factor type A (vWA) domain
MKDHILQFADILRGAGIRISPEEALDAMKGMEHVDLRERDQFRALLQTTLVKKAEDLASFQRLFDLYFGSLRVPDEQLASPAAQTGMQEPLRELLEQDNGLVSPWLQQMAMEGLPVMAAALMEAANRAGIQTIQYPMQVSRFAQKIRREFGMENGEQEVARLMERLAEAGVPEPVRASLEEELLERIRLFEEMIRTYVERQAQARLPRPEARAPNADLMEKSFGALNSWEIKSMQQAVRELAKKIRDEASLRQRRNRKGRFSLKQTLRKSLRYGGVPLEVVFRKRKKSRSRIVVLCDVSSSVWNASRFMLHLLYSLQDQFDKVRSFVFVDELGEITECFERREVNEAIETALNDAGIPYNRYTDYGSVFEQFCAERMDAVNRKTTFIVIGDGRTNFFVPGENFLGRIRKRARRVIWLNPESRGFWRFGDSMMHRYAKHCDEVLECRNLKQLITFVNKLTL